MYKRVISPLLDRFDSETGHLIVKKFFHYCEYSNAGLKLLEKLSFQGKRFSDPRLKINFSGIELENPLMVAAGWDKYGWAVKGLWQIGFGAVEVGSVLLHPQPGNPKRRQFIIAPGVAINRMGMNSPGVKVVAKNLERYKNSNVPIGINIGINKTVLHRDAPEAYAKVVKEIYSHAAYFVINVSSPNTPGLRKLQDKKHLNRIVKSVKQVFLKQKDQKPLFVKISPELSLQAIDDVIEVVLNTKLSGIVATNTTSNENIKAKYGERWRNETGGLSGDDADFRKMATEKIAYIYKQAGKKLTIIGVGGIKDFDTALEKILAGATVVQILTGLRGEGLSLPGKINHDLVTWMKDKRVKSLKEVVGKGKL